MMIPCSHYSVCRIHGIPQIDLSESRKFKVKKLFAYPVDALIEGTRSVFP